MKRRLFSILCITLLGAYLLSSCDDRSNALGIDAMPDYTKLTGLSQDYTIQWATLSADVTDNADGKTTSYNNIYVTSHYGYVGEIPNKEYGMIRSEYLTQLYCPPGFKFAETPIDGKIDSVFLSLYYTSYTGDSIAPISVEAYRLSKALPFSKYTISDVSEYASDEMLGKVSYYAGRGHGKTTGGETVVAIPLPVELGQDIYDRSVKGDAVFASQAAFDKYFPGVYVTTGAGTGSILRVLRTALTMQFKAERTVKTSDGKRDSTIIVSTHQQLSHTSEVPQLSRFENGGLDRLIATPASDNVSYIKSPAGVVTELTIPTVAIKKTLDEAASDVERVINSVPLILYGEPQGSGEYDLALPANLILLPKDSVARFFEQELTEVNSPYTTYISTRTTTGSTSYIFGNIASLINRHISANPDKDLVLRVIPVDRTTSSTSSSSSETVSTSISNLVLPSAVKLSFSGDKGKIKVIMTERKKGSPF